MRKLEMLIPNSPYQLSFYICLNSEANHTGRTQHRWTWKKGTELWAVPRGEAYNLTSTKLII
jgi:hypothetical protein